jgi:hypothetical protein
VILSSHFNIIVVFIILTVVCQSFHTSKHFGGVRYDDFSEAWKKGVDVRPLYSYEQKQIMVG